MNTRRVDFRLGSHRLLLEALVLLAMATSACGDSVGTGGSSSGATFAAASAPQTEAASDQQIYASFSSAPANPSQPSAPTASATQLIKQLGNMSMDKLFQFLVHTSDNSRVTVNGMTFASIRDKVYEHQAEFDRLQGRYSSVSEIWVYQGFNPAGVTPAIFKESLSAVGSFLGVGSATIGKDLAGQMAGMNIKTKAKSLSKACVPSLPITLNACTNDRLQVACNEMAAACLCVIHNMLAATSNTLSNKPTSSTESSDPTSINGGLAGGASDGATASGSPSDGSAMDAGGSAGSTDPGAAGAGI